MNRLKYNNENWHERDNHIFFDEGPHIYTHDKLGEMSSWTETISSYFKPFDKEGVAEFVAQRRGCSPESLIAEWEHQTELGTQLHANIEKFLLSLPYEESDVFWQFKNFFAQHPMKPFRTEWTIYDEDSRIAGTIDSLDFHVSNIMLDWKRSKNLIDRNGQVITTSFKGETGLDILAHLPDCSYYHYAMQQSGYKYILKKNYGIEVNDCWLVVFHPTLPNYRLIRLPYLENEVKAILLQRAAVFK